MRKTELACELARADHVSTYLVVKMVRGACYTERLRDGCTVGVYLGMQRLLLLLQMLLLKLHEDVWKLLLLVGILKVMEWRESRLFLTVVVSLRPVCCAHSHGLELRQQRVLTLCYKPVLLWQPWMHGPISMQWCQVGSRLGVLLLL